MDKLDFKFGDRFNVALYMSCKSCIHCKGELSYILGNQPGSDGKFCNLSFDTKFKILLELREDCHCFEDEQIVERDTTYPGATYAPHDNNHPELLDDNSDIDFNPYQPKRCLNAVSRQPYIPKINNWEDCLKQLFDRKRTIPFPHHQEVMRLLNTSSIPQYTFKIGLCPEKGMGFDRGLWFYRSIKFNSQPGIRDDMTPEAKKTAQKYIQMKSEMKKLMMVYLYRVWFLKLDVPAIKRETADDHAKRLLEFRSNLFMAFDIADKWSLAKDFGWWLLNVFKDEAALAIYPPEDELELEFIPISLLDKAQEAKMLAEAGCSSFELDLELQEFEENMRNIGYTPTEDGLLDKDGHEILY